MLISTEPTKDLGSIKFGKPHKFLWKIKNDSPNQVEINKLLVGCSSCTTAQMSKTILDPEEESTILVTFTPGKPGNHKKHISVKYDNDAILKLEFTADVYG